MKKLLLSIFFSFVAFLTYSQTVNYQIVESNPDNYKKSVLFIEPLFSEAFKGFAMGYGISFETQIADFVPWVHYKKAYLDVNTVSSQVDILPSTKLYKHSVLEIGTTWFFSDNNRDCKIGMNLNSNTVGNTVYGTSINVEGQEKVMHGLDIGFMRGKNSIDFDVDIDVNVNEDWQYERASDGYIVPMYFSEPYGTEVPEGSAWMPYTSFATSTFMVGYRYRHVYQMKIMVDYFGKRSKRTIFDWYSHLFYAPTTSLLPVVDTDGVEWNIIPVEGRKVNSHFGFRTGFNLKVANFMQFYCETGYKPGPKLKAKMLNGLFMGFGWGIFIGTKHGFLLDKYSKELI